MTDECFAKTALRPLFQKYVKPQEELSVKILVTGAKGMVGTALCNNLKNIRDGKNRTRQNIKECLTC